VPDRRIESRASKTADITCGCRAVSYVEDDPFLKGNDWVAPKLLPRQLQLIIRTRVGRRLISRLMGPDGMYEWVIARTRYVDDVFKHAASERFAQILIFGAGFDSRAVRFQAELKEARIFELDAVTTQTMKISQYRKRGIELPVNLTFVAINFEKETVAERLKAAGFLLGSKTLVLLEGVLQYLNPSAVDTTLTTIMNYVGTGSWMIFDYAHSAALQTEGSNAGDIKLRKGLAKYGESWQFGLSEDEVGAFLLKYCFKMIDRKNPRQLEEVYFKNELGIVKAHINGTQSIVVAERL
jgi:methyltransferase (TIGR00027 family)